MRWIAFMGKCAAGDLLVIEDLNLLTADCIDPSSDVRKNLKSTFLQREDEWRGWLGTIKVPIDYCPRIIAMINRHLPDFTVGLWNELYEHHRAWTLVVLYADILRWDGLGISKQVSWERTAQDFLTQLYTDPDLQFLGEFQHVVVRFGVTGAIHSYRVGKHQMKRRAHRLYFDPAAPQYGIYRDASIDGDLIGNNSTYVASLFQELLEFVNSGKSCLNEYALAETIGDGIRQAIVRTQLHFGAGYGSSVKTVASRFTACGGFNADWFAKYDARERIGDERIPVGDLSWNILNQSAGYRLIEVAHDIVVKGVDDALNKRSRNGVEPVWAPVVKFEGSGKRLIELVDRREIESFRSVHNMLRQARSDTNRRRPLSIAVFGPPGSGKSYGIKVLAESAGFELRNAVLDRNLAECKSPDMLRMARKWACRTQWKMGTPLLFFDEFDCRFETRELGWLKYFLSMMEDWDPGNPPKGADRSAPPKGGPPIFIFAGGTSYTYRDFSRGGIGGKEQELRFARAKGPDFVSRLSGHIDIIGPNPTDEYDQAYVIRRALVLRRILKDKEVPHEYQDATYDAWFQNELIRAMLTVSTYKHGSRSMRAIVDMCVRFGGEHGRYVTTSLPPAHQLDMHVDGKEFLRRVEEGKEQLEMEKVRDKRRMLSGLSASEGIQRFAALRERAASADDQQRAMCRREFDDIASRMREADLVKVAYELYSHRSMRTTDAARQAITEMIFGEENRTAAERLRLESTSNPS